MPMGIVGPVASGGVDSSIGEGVPLPMTEYFGLGPNLGAGANTANHTHGCIGAQHPFTRVRRSSWGPLIFVGVIGTYRGRERLWGRPGARNMGPQTNNKVALGG